MSLRLLKEGITQMGLTKADTRSNKSARLPLRSHAVAQDKDTLRSRRRCETQSVNENERNAKITGCLLVLLQQEPLQYRQATSQGKARGSRAGETVCQFKNIRVLEK